MVVAFFWCGGDSAEGYDKQKLGCYQDRLAGSEELKRAAFLAV
jgi:hypothetical protein